MYGIVQTADTDARRTASPTHSQDAPCMAPSDSDQRPSFNKDIAESSGRPSQCSGKYDWYHRCIPILSQKDDESSTGSCSVDSSSDSHSVHEPVPDHQQIEGADSAQSLSLDQIFGVPNLHLHDAVWNS